MPRVALLWNVHREQVACSDFSVVRRATMIQPPPPRTRPLEQAIAGHGCCARAMRNWASSVPTAWFAVVFGCESESA